MIKIVIIMAIIEAKKHAAQLQRIGNNINHIVKRMNQTDSLYMTDVAEVKKLLHEIWLSEKIEQLDESAFLVGKVIDSIDSSSYDWKTIDEDVSQYGYELLVLDGEKVT